MMKSILFTLLTLISVNSFAQITRVKFTDATFENGMLYPIAHLAGSEIIADKINKNILENIQDLKDADFCVGQYGFVQKGAHLQIHIFCNCIDFKESQNRHYLYNLENGDNVKYSDILTPNKIKAATKFLNELTSVHINTNGLTVDPGSVKLIEDENFDAFKVIFKRDGLDMWLKDEGWGKKPMFISWGALRPYMKYSFI